MIDFSYNDEMGVLRTTTGGDLSIEEILGHYQEIGKTNRTQGTLK